LTGAGTAAFNCSRKFNETFIDQALLALLCALNAVTLLVLTPQLHFTTPFVCMI
jgi:hypothetical protein